MLLPWIKGVLSTHSYDSDDVLNAPPSQNLASRDGFRSERKVFSSVDVTEARLAPMR